MTPAKFLRWFILLVITANVVIVAIVLSGGNKTPPAVPARPPVDTQHPGTNMVHHP